MTHEEIKASLSAYHDGELPEAEVKEISGHLAECASCAAALAGLKELSAEAKAGLAAAAPAGLKARVLSRAAGKKRLRPSAVLAAAFAALVLALAAAVMVKRVAPAMFAQIQGMINAAASTLGSSKGNN